MKIPPKNHPNWEKFVRGQIKFQPDFLGLKIAMGHYRIMLNRVPTSNMVNECIDDAHGFFVKNIRFPQVQEDLRKIFSEEAILE